MLSNQRLTWEKKLKRFPANNGSAFIKENWKKNFFFFSWRNKDHHFIFQNSASYDTNDTVWIHPWVQIQESVPQKDFCKLAQLFFCRLLQNRSYYCKSHHSGLSVQMLSFDNSKYYVSKDDIEIVEVTYISLGYIFK